VKIIAVGKKSRDQLSRLYGDKVIHTERLTVPHYGLKEREFMLYPLAEIAPDLIFPTSAREPHRARATQLNCAEPTSGRAPHHPRTP